MNQVTDEAAALPPAATERLRPLQHILIALFFIAVVVFGGLTLMRSAFLVQRHTDAGVYFRAAWAVRAHDNIYLATDNNGWHYHYPPLLATLLVPLADPPPGAVVAKGAAVVPYPVSVAIWYAIGVAAVAFAAHSLASAVEQLSRGPRGPGYRYGVVWWWLRLGPVLLVASPLAHSLGRGQINPLVLLCLVGMAAELMRKHSARAGLWLAFAMSLKVFPAYLLILPFWRRDWVCLASCAAGLVAGFLLIPGLIAGFPEAIGATTDFGRLLSTQLLGSGTSIRSAELFNEAAGDLMSFKSLLFKMTHLLSMPRPVDVPRLFAVLHVALAGIMTLVSLWSIGWWPRKPSATEDPLVPLLLAGILITVSVPMVPTAQSHYFALSLVLTMGLFAHWRGTDGVIRMPPMQVALLGLAFVLSFIREIPGFRFMTDLGAPVISGMIMWAIGLHALRERVGSGAGMKSAAV